MTCRRMLLTALMSVALLVPGCGSPETLTREELMARTGTWQDADAVWYYTGSSDRYDFFRNRDSSIESAYRVPYGEVPLSRRFPLTGDRSRWAAMPWGPAAGRPGS